MRELRLGGRCDTCCATFEIWGIKALFAAERDEKWIWYSTLYDMSL